ncbi:MAG TPA: ATP-binding protein, partial [Xanthobacteraceae bacterium]
TSLRNYRNALDEAGRDELIGTIQEEAERLNRFIANLLDMTRLVSGALVPHLEPVDLGDIVGSALERAQKFLGAHKVEIDLARPLPLLRLDPVLFEQVLFNLLDNAAKYAPPRSPIRVQARREGAAVRLQVIDEGPGIPPADLDRIFDKFYRVRARDRQRAGTGLGLAVCRGFVEAMGGRIVAANRQEQHGAVFAITLPVAADPSAATEALA